MKTSRVQMKIVTLAVVILIAVLFPLMVSAAGSSEETESSGSEGMLREEVEGKTLTLSGGGTFPTRQIELIVPLSAGGGTDVFCRQLSAAMYKVLGQPVVVKNLPGAAGLRGIGVAMEADPDGYTLVASNPPGEQIPWLIQKPGYDMEELTTAMNPLTDLYY